jgi:hypothetical protein
MNTFKSINARLGRVGLAFAALISIAAMATPASADNSNNRGNGRYYHHHRHDNDGFFSFGFGGPVYSDPPYYYAPPPRYYAPPPVYYYPQPRYYQPGPSFNLTIPLGTKFAISPVGVCHAGKPRSIPGGAFFVRPCRASIAGTGPAPLRCLGAAAMLMGRLRRTPLTPSTSGVAARHDLMHRPPPAVLRCGLASAPAVQDW